jgi:ribonuclease P protein component
MLPKKFRITYPDFQKNEEKIFKVFGLCIDIFIKSNKSGFNRFVFIIPKYVDKRSTHRHRIRRVMVEVVRSMINNMNTQNDILVKCKKKIDTNKKEIIEKEIVSLMKKAGLIK